MLNHIEGRQRRSYQSYEEYLAHFYRGTAGQSEESVTLNLEASFGKRLAKRVREVEAAEKPQDKIEPNGQYAA